MKNNYQKKSVKIKKNFENPHMKKINKNNLKISIFSLSIPATSFSVSWFPRFFFSSLNHSPSHPFSPSTLRLRSGTGISPSLPVPQSSSYFGKENINSSPPPFLVLAEISPLKLRMAFFTIAKPSPVPPCLRDLPESTL